MYYAQIRTTPRPFHSFADVSSAYRRTIEHLGLGASQTPPCTIFDETGMLVAHVSYNGRVWAGSSYQPGAVPLYEPA